MEIKLENGTIFTIEVQNTSISIQKKLSDNENIEILTPNGCKLTLKDNMFYVV